LDKLFLDANVLFSAAYRPDAGVRRLWRLPGARLVTSSYALEEARRNLTRPEQRADLEKLSESLEVLGAVAESEGDSGIVGTVDLPEKDRPILLAAMSAGATHLITGEFAHFGPYYGQRVGGVLIIPPARSLREFAGPVARF
jgi:predicted nucleic acid-binding protein